MIACKIDGVRERAVGGREEAGECGSVVLSFMRYSVVGG